jgi:hypothetical protein
VVPVNAWTAIGYLSAVALILIGIFGPGGFRAYPAEKHDRPGDELTSIADAVGVTVPLPLRQASPGAPLTPKELADLAGLEAQFTVPHQRTEQP